MSIPDSGSCGQFIDLVPVYLGGADFEGRAAFVAHVARCEGCRRELMESAKLAKELAIIFEGPHAPAPDYARLFSGIVGQLAAADATQEKAKRSQPAEAIRAGSAELAIASSLMRGMAGAIRGARAVSSPAYWVRLGRMATASVLPNG